MRAGPLDRRITLWTYGISYNSDNEPIEGYTNAGTVSASWRRASAREVLASSEIGAMASDVFEVHFTSTVAGLNPKDRLTYQGAEYNITAVDEIGRREGLRIAATKRADT